MATSAMVLGRGTRQLVGFKEHFALGSSDMVWMVFFKAVSNVEILPCGLCSFLHAYHTQFGGNTYD